MKTKVEPTVEAWEKDFINKFGGKSYRKYIGGSWENEKQHRRGNVQAGIKNKELTIDDYEWYPNPNFNIPEVIKHIHTLLSHSLQEAKAERDKRIMEEINSEHERLMEVTRGTFPDRYSNDYLHGILRGYTLLGRFMASLKQEEET